jgi:cytochrome o ubiquinol oxidase operon protein cyoD
MSAEPQAVHNDHGAAHHGQQDEAGHGSLKGYVTGFVLAVILTAIPFWLVMGGVLPSARVTGFVVMGFAVVQMVVHMVYFLHMNTRAEGGWTMLALLFTLVLVVITIAGSLWIMFHLDNNMMPMPHDMRTMP